MYPFIRRSLTASIDSLIHQEVRAAAPFKYWMFRVSSQIERIAFLPGVLGFLVYFVSYAVARSKGYMGAPAFAEIVDVLSIWIVLCVCGSVTGGLLQSILFPDLEKLAEQAVLRISSNFR